MAASSTPAPDDVFSWAIAHPGSQALSSPLDEVQRKLWTQVGSGYFFRVRTYSVEFGALIDAAAAESPPTRLVFTDRGHVKVTVSAEGEQDAVHIEYNPFDTDTVRDTNQPSIAQVSGANAQYVYDATHFITRSLRYVLRKEPEHGVWELLYNPLHRGPFRDLFMQSLAAAQPGDVDFGATKSRTEAHMSHYQLFQNYCQGLTVLPPGRAAGDKAYLDPTCNIFLSAQQCTASSLFDTNRVTHSASDVQRNSAILEKLVAGSPPNCMCMGRPYSYYKSNISESFLDDFQSMSSCSPDMQVNVCTVINRANTINMTDSSLSAECGGGVSDVQGGGETITSTQGTTETVAPSSGQTVTTSNPAGDEGGGAPSSWEEMALADENPDDAPFGLTADEQAAVDAALSPTASAPPPTASEPPAAPPPPAASAEDGETAFYKKAGVAVVVLVLLGGIFFLVRSRRRTPSMAGPMGYAPAWGGGGGAPMYQQGFAPPYGYNY